jgi:hypothetical protein
MKTAPCSTIDTINMINLDGTIVCRTLIVRHKRTGISVRTAEIKSRHTADFGNAFFTRTPHRESN